MPGTEIVLPSPPSAANRQGQVARILISKQGFYRQALDAQGHVLYYGTGATLSYSRARGSS